MNRQPGDEPCPPACARLRTPGLMRYGRGMKRTFAGLFLYFLASVLFAESAAAFKSGEVAVVTQGGRFVISVEIASTDDERSMGLQNRQKLDAGAGMLFDFKVQKPVSMWMKNTPIPLDMVFAAENGRIVNIAHATTPYSLSVISSKGPVRWVLELNAGTSIRLGISPGDRLEFGR